MPSCDCRTLLGGVVYKDDCQLHTSIPAFIPCVRCEEPIVRGEPRVPIAGPDGTRLPVHVTCSDVRERLGLADDIPPMMRAEESARRKRGADDGTPLFMQPGRMARLRRRR